MRPSRFAGPAVALAVAFGVAGTPGHAAENPFQRGPEPTLTSVQAEKGPYAVSQVSVAAGSGPGFNRGTIYYPTSTADGDFGAVAVMPGFTGPEFSVAWYGPRLASQGFVVFTLEPTTVLDFPDQRADQMLAALDYLKGGSAVKDRVDGDRMAVMGHSMGGGGSLRAAEKRPSLKAAIPLAPWHYEKNWAKVEAATLIFAADNDWIAAPANHAKPFYDSLTGVDEKAYVMQKNAGHVQYILPNTVVAQYSIAWLKRFVDEDTRYSPFLCPGPATGALIAQYAGTCPV